MWLTECTFKSKARFRSWLCSVRTHCLNEWQIGWSYLSLVVKSWHECRVKVSLRLLNSKNVSGLCCSDYVALAHKVWRWMVKNCGYYGILQLRGNFAINIEFPLMQQWWPFREVVQQWNWNFKTCPCICFQLLYVLALSLHISHWSAAVNLRPMKRKREEVEQSDHAPCGPSKQYKVSVPGMLQERLQAFLTPLDHLLDILLNTYCVNGLHFNPQLCVSPFVQILDQAKTKTSHWLCQSMPACHGWCFTVKMDCLSTLHITDFIEMYIRNVITFTLSHRHSCSTHAQA